MEAIGIRITSSSPSSNIVVLHSNGTRSLLSSSTAKSMVTASFLKHSISLKGQRSIRPVSAFASLSQQDSVQVDLEASSSETEIQETEEANACSVRVKFLLQKECSFGEQFLLVGDDSVLGLWDPENGVPLDWSDGHVWAVELDIPIGKTIKYKFILKGIDGKLMWQPDPDRVLEPWETQSTIVVVEDWEDPLVQKVMEEDDEGERTIQSVVVKEEPFTDEEDPNHVLDDLNLQVEAATLALQEIVSVVEEELEASESLAKEEPTVDEEDPVLQIAAENMAVPESEPVSISTNEESFSVADVSVATQLEKPIASIMPDDNISHHHQGEESITQNGSGQVSDGSMNSDQKVEPVLPLSDDNVEDGDEDFDSVDGILVPEEAGLAVLVPGLLHTVQETPSEDEATEGEGSATASDASVGEVVNPGKSITIEYDKEEANGERTVELLSKDDHVEAVVDGDERAPVTDSTTSNDGILVPEEEGVAVLVPGLLSPVLEMPSEEEATNGDRSVSVEGTNNGGVENPSGEEKAIAVQDKEEAIGEETEELSPKEEEEKPDDVVSHKSPSSASGDSRCKFPTPSGEAENVLQNDMQWVQKLLSNLGLL